MLIRVSFTFVSYFHISYFQSSSFACGNSHPPSGEWAEFPNKVVDRLKNNKTRTETAANFQLPGIN